MYKVEQAIIMAAGIGKRMQPVSLKTPKPLIKVNGISMIDTVVNALENNGITKITIVVGYLKEQFYQWAKDKKNINIVENPYYETCNNISSLYVAKDYLKNTIILDGDQIIYNEKILSPEFEKSGYNGVWVEEQTSEWLMQVVNNKVKSCSRTGGNKGWQLYSISRWCEEDCEKLKKYLEVEFIQKNNKQIYWDDVAMFCHFDDFDLGVKPMNKDDIIEIDNFDELLEIDKSYLNYKE